MPIAWNAGKILWANGKLAFADDPCDCCGSVTGCCGDFIMPSEWQLDIVGVVAGSGGPGSCTCSAWNGSFLLTEPRNTSGDGIGYCKPLIYNAQGGYGWAYRYTTGPCGGANTEWRLWISCDVVEDQIDIFVGIGNPSTNVGSNWATGNPGVGVQFGGFSGDVDVSAYSQDLRTYSASLTPRTTIPPFGIGCLNPTSVTITGLG